jgi:hypothetical protein
MIPEISSSPDRGRRFPRDLPCLPTGADDLSENLLVPGLGEAISPLVGFTSGSGRLEDTLRGGRPCVPRRRPPEAHDETLRVWDVDHSATIAVFTGESAFVALAVVDSRIIVAGDASGRVHILDLVESTP